MKTGVRNLVVNILTDLYTSYVHESVSIIYWYYHGTLYDETSKRVQVFE